MPALATTPAISHPVPAEALRAQVRALAENRPGVYRMIGPGERVLYVGKSIRVRTRLLGYFRERRGAKGEELLRHTHRIEWEYVPGEFAALLLEMQSIKRWRPPYNVVHKRDRSFCFIRLTRESAARLQAVPRVVADGARYFGPFAGPERVRAAVREIADVLELRDCASNTPLRFTDQLEFFAMEAKAPLCLRGDLGRCMAPCAGRCARHEYRARAELTLRFLQGEADAPLQRLRERMEAASSRTHFEYAATLRDRIHRLEELREELVALRSTIEALTFVYTVAGADQERIYVLRHGLVLAELPAPRDDQEMQQLRARAAMLLRAAPRGRDGIDATAASEILMVAAWFRNHPEELSRTWHPDDAAVPAGLPV